MDSLVGTDMEERQGMALEELHGTAMLYQSTHG